MNKPNIIFILSDQHNSAYMGCTGEFVRTPTMDALAQRGVRFNNCYCNSPLCVPSRSSLLAGLLPEKTEIYNNTQCLRSDRVTFVHNLSAAGYETVLAGRMHFVGPDQRHGYEKRFVGDLTSFFLGLDLGEERYGYLKGTPMPGRTAIEKSGKGCSSVLKYDEAVQQSACDYLRERSDNRPLFLTVGFFGPHPPYVGHEDLFDYYYRILPDTAPLTQDEKASLHEAAKRFLELRNIGNETAEEVRRVRAAYCAMVEYLDTLIGSLLHTVEMTLGLQNTVIIYASDHGDSMGEHGMYAKSNFYEGASRVPFIWSWPGRFEEGSTVSGLTSLVDLAPTLLDIGNASALPEQDGESLLPYLTGGHEPPADRIVISQLADIKGDNPSIMLRRGEYKLVRHVGLAAELYNLRDDPKELHNLATYPEYAPLVGELSALLEPHWDEEEIICIAQKNKKHVELMKAWAAAQHVRPIEAWSGDAKADNYLL